MKASKRMRAVITRALAKNGKSIDDPGLHLRIESGSYMPLTIERTWENLLSVCHYAKDDYGDAYQDPEVVFLIGCDGEWYPIEIQRPDPQVGQFYRRYAEIDGHKGTWSRCDLQGQADLATFCTFWANNIARQGFA